MGAVISKKKSLFAYFVIANYSFFLHDKFESLNIIAFPILYIFFFWFWYALQMHIFTIFFFLVVYFSSCKIKTYSISSFHLLYQYGLHLFCVTWYVCVLIFDIHLESVHSFIAFYNSFVQNVIFTWVTWIYALYNIPFE